MVLSPLLLLWNTIMLYDIPQIPFFDRSIKSFTFYETSWCIRPWLCCIVAKTNTSPNDSLNSFNGSTYWSFKNLQFCYQNTKCIFGVYPWKIGNWKSSVSHLTTLGRVSLAKSYTGISRPREENRAVDLPTLPLELTHWICFPRTLYINQNFSRRYYRFYFHIDQSQHK